MDMFIVEKTSLEEDLESLKLVDNLIKHLEEKKELEAKALLYELTPLLPVKFIEQISIKYPHMMSTLSSEVKKLEDMRKEFVGKLTAHYEELKRIYETEARKVKSEGLSEDLRCGAAIEAAKYLNKLNISAVAYGIQIEEKGHVVVYIKHKTGHYILDLAKKQFGGTDIPAGFLYVISLYPYRKQITRVVGEIESSCPR